MDGVRDLRRALRRWSLRPGLALAVIAILAIGIGLTTTAVSVVERVLLRPIPVPHLGRLVVAWEADPSRGQPLIEVSYPYFQDWRSENESFEDLAAFGSVNWSYQLRDRSGVATLAYSAVSASFFDTLEARPLLGRTFLPDDDAPGAPRVAVLSHALWQRRFGGRQSVVGMTVTLSDRPFTVVGVMPPGFDFPRGAELWTCVGPELAEMSRQQAHPPAFWRGLGILYVVGRLKPEASAEDARADLAALSRRLSVADGFSPAGWDARIEPLVDNYLGVDTRRALQAVAVASGLVLLLACSNVGVLLLVRAIGRLQDLAVRRALGAGAVRLALGQVADAALPALVGGAAGLGIAAAAIHAIGRLGPSGVAGLRDVALDGRAVAFALLATLGTAALTALAPAWMASRGAVVGWLRSRGGGLGTDRHAWALGRLIVGSEVALSIVLLVGSGLMVRSLVNLLGVELGFVPAHTLSFSVATLREGDDHAFQRELIERLEALPGVEAVGAVHNRPLEHGAIGDNNWIFPEGHGTDWDAVRAYSISVDWELVTPGYFRAVGTRLVAGRGFDASDTAPAPKVAIVSASVARRIWPGERPLGKRINTGGARWDPEHGIYEWQTVVGVVEDARYREVEEPSPAVYLPETQAKGALSYFVVRTTGPPLALVGAVREQVHDLDPAAGVENLTTMTRLVDRAMAPWRLTSALLAAFALAGLLLTASGLVAVLQYFVSGRRREIAVRVALGAGPARVRAFVLRQGLAVALLGLGLGLALAAVLTRALSALLYEVHAGDWWSYAGAVGLLLLVAVAACLWPARRATRVDPMLVLRSE